MRHRDVHDTHGHRVTLDPFGSAAPFLRLPVAWRRFATAALRLARPRRQSRRVVVVGDRERAMEAVAAICRDALPVGILLDRDAPPHPILGGFIDALANAEEVVREQGADTVVVALPWSESERLAACVEVFKPLAVDVHLFPDNVAPFLAGGTSLLAGVPMARLRLRPMGAAGAWVKAAEDRLLGGLLLLLTLPLMLAVALAVKLDSPGPVLFRQKRCGYDNRPFTCLKFRSMRVEAAQTGDGTVVQATRDDCRVTRVGRFIRRTSLDELPQLLNVLGGSMSLVGPRPHALAHHHTYAGLVDDYRCRHRMKPGLTGWAQVNGWRGETVGVEQMQMRVMHDLWYIDHWSVWLDLAILARTPLACLRGTNAY